MRINVREPREVKTLKFLEMVESGDDVSRVRARLILAASRRDLTSTSVQWLLTISCQSLLIGVISRFRNSVPPGLACLWLVDYVFTAQVLKLPDEGRSLVFSCWRLFFFLKNIHFKASEVFPERITPQSVECEWFKHDDLSLYQIIIILFLIRV